MPDQIRLVWKTGSLSLAISVFMVKCYPQSFMFMIHDVLVSQFSPHVWNSAYCSKNTVWISLLSINLFLCYCLLYDDEKKSQTHLRMCWRWTRTPGFQSDSSQTDVSVPDSTSFWTKTNKTSLVKLIQYKYFWTSKLPVQAMHETQATSILNNQCIPSNVRRLKTHKHTLM